MILILCSKRTTEGVAASEVVEVEITTMMSMVVLEAAAAAVAAAVVVVVVEEEEEEEEVATQLRCVEEKFQEMNK
jgi:adenylate kinase